MLPQCPPLANLVINTLKVKWWHIAPRKATCVFFCSGHNYSFLAFPCINSLPALHQGWLHFHINYCYYGNCPKAVITQVVIATIAVWHWAECSSSDDFKVDTDNIVLVFYFPTFVPSARIKQPPLWTTCCCPSSQVSFMYCSTADGQQVNSEIYCCCIHTHTPQIMLYCTLAYCFTY